MLTSYSALAFFHLASSFYVRCLNLAIILVPKNPFFFIFVASPVCNELKIIGLWKKHTNKWSRKLHNIFFATRKVLGDWKTMNWSTQNHNWVHYFLTKSHIKLEITKLSFFQSPRIWADHYIIHNPNYNNNNFIFWISGVPKKNVLVSHKKKMFLDRCCILIKGFFGTRWTFLWDTHQVDKRETRESARFESLICIDLREIV